MGKKDANSYRNILRGTSLFGGVQVFHVLINLVRGKLVAMLLGPAGMGISALFASSATTIQRFASLGLNLAIVKETASKNEDPEALVTTISIARQLITATAIVGALICILFSSFLSRVTFGNDRMTLQFILLGAVVGLSVAYNGKLSILQGIQEVKRISVASLIGGITGLVVGVPLYYFFGDDGIVPAMVVLALAMYLFYSFSLSRSIKLPNVKFIWQSHKPIVKTLVVLGLLLMANDLIMSLVQYLTNIFIKNYGSTDAVGLYQAANSVTNQYSGMVFTAMAMDYFPRLSKVASDNNEMRNVVNRQTEIVALIITPASTLLILTAPIVIRLLLTSEFLTITPLMRWMGLGILIRALSIPMGYISFAKGNRKLFFWFEGIICNGMTLVYSCIFYYFFGLIGLGYALVADNLSCLILYYIVNRHMYDYRFSKESAINLGLAIAIGTLVFYASLIESVALSYSIMTVLTVISIIYAFIVLRKKLSRTSDITESTQED
ncbi:MAG: O-antigen translocase [Muribaculaceae bacterium]|nr:O-antigen translocase [Muribaculaceae bacterium]